MKRFKSTALAVVAFAFVATGLLTGQSVSAQGSASLSIAPKKTYNIEPGKSVDDTLTIRNLDRDSDLNLTMRVIDFTYTGDGGTPKLFLDENTQQTTWSLKPYLSVPKTVTVPKSGSATVDISVAIPANRGAGSLYSAIIYSTGAPDGGNVGLAASGVTLVFTNIPGKVNQDLRLQKLGAYRDAVLDRDTTVVKEAGYVFLTNDEPKKIAYTLKNNGNVTEAPLGSITVKNLFFGQEYNIDKVNPSGSLALIGQARTFTSCLKLEKEEVRLQGVSSESNTCAYAGLWPGLFSINLDLYYGQNGNITREIKGSATFWFMPLWFIVLLIVLLILIGLGIWRLTIIVRRKLGKGNFKKSTRRK